MPDYFACILEEEFEDAIVVNVELTEDDIKAIFLVSLEEKKALLKALHEAKKGENTWDILNKVHNELRAEN